MNNNSERLPCCLTGATGFVGGEILSQLRSAGVPVRAATRRLAGRRETLQDEPGITWIEVNWDDPRSLERFCQGGESLIHCAGPSAWHELGDPGVEGCIATMALGLLEASQAAGHRRFLFISSVAALGPAPGAMELLVETSRNPIPEHLYYARGKRRASDWVLAAATRGFETAVLCPSEVYGAGPRAEVTAVNLRRMLRQRPRLMPGGSTGLVGVRDVAAAAVAAWERGGAPQVYLANGGNATLRALADQVSLLAGKAKPYGTVPDGLLKGVLSQTFLRHLILGDSATAADYGRYHWSCDDSWTRRQLGLNPAPPEAILEEALTGILGSKGVKRRI